LRVQGKPRAEIESAWPKRAAPEAEPYLNHATELSGASSSEPRSRAPWSRAPIWCCSTTAGQSRYKLRENCVPNCRDLRASGAIFVYATTEPSSPAARRPHGLHVGRPDLAGRRYFEGLSPSRDARVAQVFSDRRSTSSASKRKMMQCAICGGIQAPASGLYAQLATDPIASVPRPPARGRQWHRRPSRLSGHRHRDEITGSESFVHLNRDASNWVAVLQGVHDSSPVTCSMPCSIPTMSLCSTRPTVSRCSIAFSSEAYGGSLEENASTKKSM